MCLYVFAVVFDVMGGEMTIYEPLHATVAELQAETEEGEIEMEVEVDE